ncbi:MAG: hypothetical protein ACNA8W_12175 [Bradymonadaceae bacterium]
MIRKAIIIGLVCGLGSMSLSCGTTSIVDRAVNRSVDQAATRVGDQMGKAIAGHLLSNLSPALMQAYTVGLFQMLFYQGGYHFTFADYEPGQYTRWQGREVDHGETFEKALLRRNEDGTEWWRVESRGRDDGEEVVVIMEALMSAEDETGVRHIRRMRAKYPNETEPREVPISEGEANQWAVRTDHKLTPESTEGMRVGARTLETPAGTFETEHLQTSHAGYSRLNWWVVRDGTVPGGMVRYSQHEQAPEGEQGELLYEMTLIEYGEDATESKLGVF